MADALVWVALDADGAPHTIFRNHKQAAQSSFQIAEWLRKTAVEKIRHAVFIRDNWKCTNCGDESLTWETAEMHERLHRGHGGNISIANGRTLCHTCHMQDEEAGHGKRQPQWSASSGKVL